MKRLITPVKDIEKLEVDMDIIEKTLLEWFGSFSENDTIEYSGSYDKKINTFQVVRDYIVIQIIGLINNHYKTVSYNVIVLMINPETRIESRNITNDQVVEFLTINNVKSYIDSNK